MKKLTLTNDQYLKYLERNEIKPISHQDLFGCCVITEDIIVTMGAEKEEIYIITTFNGEKKAIKRHDLYHNIMWAREIDGTTPYVILNLTVSNYYKTYIKKKYSYDEYNPSVIRIVRYLKNGPYSNKVDKFKNISTKDLGVAQTNMTTEQTNNLISKLNIMGILWLQVDYHTIAVVRNNEQVLLYTQQMSIGM
jgi:hypothetical protein